MMLILSLIMPVFTGFMVLADDLLYIAETDEMLDFYDEFEEEDADIANAEGLSAE